MTTRSCLIKISNALLSVFYILGALVVLFPKTQSAIPTEFGYISVGVLLLATGIFGSPYYADVGE